MYEDMHKDYKEALKNNRNTSDVFDYLMSNVNDVGRKFDEDDIIIVLSAKFKLSLDERFPFNSNVLNIIEKIKDEYNQTGNKKLLYIIEVLDTYREKRKLSLEKYYEEEKFKEENSTPEEIVKRINDEIDEQKWKSIKEEIDYDYYDTYKEVINEVNLHKEYSESERVIMLAKNSSQKVSNIFLKQIKKHLPKEYYHFKSLVEKISPD